MFSSSLPKTILRLIVVLGLLIFSTWSFYNYQQAQQELEALQTQAEDPAEIAQRERQQLLAAAGRLMVLPEGEPLILDIENAEALAQAQPFFIDAVDGDKLLVYLQAGRSIIYSPSRNIIVNVGTLTAENPSQLEATESTEAEAAEQ